MAKYSVVIPAPSAKRMAANRRIIVELSDGWNGSSSETYQISADASSFEFEAPDDYDWKYNTSICDGSVFAVYCESSNASGSRKEKCGLVPQKL